MKFYRAVTLLANSREQPSQFVRALINKIAFAASCMFLSACGGGNSAEPTAAQETNLLAQSGMAPPLPPTANIPPTPPSQPAVPPPTQQRLPVPVPNDAGAALTFTTAGVISMNNPFFKPFGNGRACASCHQENQGWSLTPDRLQAKFEASNGTDPVFRLVDGANAPNLKVSTLDEKRSAYSMLLTKGLIRVGMPIPVGAEFTLAKADDPYGFASAAELSLFRRPLPTTNLKFITTVMWDARETFLDSSSRNCVIGSAPLRCYADRDFDLRHQANSAVRGHAEAAQDLTAAEQRAIVDFENTLFTAQITDVDAGSLTADGARGGPQELSKNDFYFGINDFTSGDYRTRSIFNTNAMTLFDAWQRPLTPPRGGPINPQTRFVQPLAVDLARASIARGEAIFNSRPMNIVGVNGLNDELRVASFKGTCTTCHSTPNSGTHSVPRTFDIGVSSALLRTPDMPLYTLKNSITGETIDTTDPGRAMQTGKWKDIGKLKVPSLRGIESRSPYFHNGVFNELDEVVKFYDRRFRLGLSPQEVEDLTAFLRAL